MENKTETGFIVITVEHRSAHMEYNRIKFNERKYETMVFPCKNDGSPDIDRCVKTKYTYSEDKAYLCHLQTWESFRGNND
jgi:hypothetical protein